MIHQSGTCCPKLVVKFSLLLLASSIIILNSTQHTSAAGPSQASATQVARPYNPFRPPQVLTPVVGATHQASGASSQQTNVYSQATNELYTDLRKQLLTKSTKFDDLFRSLLSNSKRSLHNMFVLTYGKRYEENVQVFTDMFDDLGQYYTRGDLRLADTMKSFFEKLYLKIFSAANPLKLFSQNCVIEQLEQLKPFKDVPERLTNEIRHVFVAARTFNQMLIAGNEVIRNIILLGQPAQCANLINDKLLKYTNSNNPTGVAKPQPCLSYCEQVISRCIGRDNLEQLSDKWRNYTTAFADLGLKLSVRYNIETVIAPLDLQISEAIMVFQENVTNISNHVMGICGQGYTIDDINRHSINNRLKRFTAGQTSPSARQQLRYPANPTNRNGFGRGEPPNPFIATNQQNNFMIRGSPTFLANEDPILPSAKKSAQLTEEIRNYMLSMKNFWSTLPNAVCTSNLTLGPAAARKQPKTGECFTEPLGVLDLNTDMRFRQEIQNQATKLDEMRLKILNAIKGVESEPIDPKTGPIHGKLVPPMPSFTTTTLSPDAVSEDEEYEIDDDNGSTTEFDEADSSTPIYDEDDTSDYSTDAPPTTAKDDPLLNPIETTFQGDNELITAPDARKSGASSAKNIVITYHVALLLFMLCTLGTTHLWRTQLNTIHLKRELH